MSTPSSAAALHAFARDLLIAAGLACDPAHTVAHVLLEGDLLGHDTHGLALLGPYLNELANGTMQKIIPPGLVLLLLLQLD